MIRYMVDGRPLLQEEDARHRGACNAALFGILTHPRASIPGNHEAVVRSAFDKADQVVREYRLRSEEPKRPAADPEAPYRLAESEDLIARWVEGDFDFTLPRNLAIGKLRKLTFPLTLAQVAQGAEIREDLLRELLFARVLVPAEEAPDAG